ncbi:HPr kinase/phosphatase C-terminal domain-containing protein [Rhodopseudomonas palustris]|uniref:HPr kinase/phosphorylase n=1 Tax=Rhodopseudomonas palustris TaxID=1076 RepID=UPI0021F3A60A|nr:HPr kinase/phosphatase C-terminal domain-containing protein [Rhodopseudomonas palustris]UYO44803.1 HPr kinase/phosphatase C-terminal domain-containing protein [Rhodopseudomonas palustris]
MIEAVPRTVHASAVKVGDLAVVIRGPSGSGKSRLAWALILAGRAGQIPPVELIGDDRVFMEPDQGRVTVRQVPELAGMIEIRGLGLRRTASAIQAVAGLVVDLDAADASRMPEASARRTEIGGVQLPRVPVGAGYDPLPLVVAALTTTDAAEEDA